MSQQPAALLLLFCVLLLLLTVICVSSADSAEPLPLVCIVIRTYYAHGTYGDSSLINLLRSLKQQTHPRWQALLLVMDNRPFPDLRHIVRDAEDERVQVFAEWISARNQPRTNDGQQWAPEYHTRLYNLTDEAIRACPRDTTWLVVSNGDNDFDPAFLSVLVQQRPVQQQQQEQQQQQPLLTGNKEGSEADVPEEWPEVVAFDYYSRFQRPTGIPCERFAAGPGHPPCKTNELRWCQTDLAANAYFWPRFIADDMRFGVLDSGVGASHDGFMADVVRTRKWKVARIAGRCLVDHAPSPQSCAAMEGVWDDTAAGSDAGAGGRCLQAGRAARLLEQLGDEAELVTLDVAHDTSFGLPAGPLQLRCVRLASKERHKDLAAFFPAQCVAAIDDDSGGAGGGTAAV